MINSVRRVGEDRVASLVLHNYRPEDRGNVDKERVVGQIPS